MARTIVHKGLCTSLGFILLLGLILLPWPSHAALVNSTIDDDAPDPLTGQRIAYSPQGAWINGKECRNCGPAPRQELLHRGTWHHGTFNRTSDRLTSASIAFTGTAIYVYCLLPRTTEDPPGYADMRFLIDNQVAGTFERTPPGAPGYEYDVLVFSKRGLPHEQHYFVLQAGRIGGPDSLVLLDRITYSYDDGTTSSGTLGAIIGGAVAGVIVLCALLAFAYRRYSQRRKERAQATSPEASETGSMEYPVVVPFREANPSTVHTIARDQNISTSHGSVTSLNSHAVSVPPSARSKPRSHRPQPTASQRPSMSTLYSSAHGYRLDQVDVYDPYNNRLSFSSNPTTATTYFGPSTSSGSATVHPDNPPAYAYEPTPIPLSPLRTEHSKASSKQSMDKKPS